MTRKALPAIFNIDQLDEELRVALGLQKRPGVIRAGEAVPQIVTRQRLKAAPRAPKQSRRKRGDLPPPPVVVPPVVDQYEDVPWTEAQQKVIADTMAAHVASPLWGEKNLDRIIRLTRDNVDFDAYLAKANADITAIETVRAVKDLIRFAKAAAKRLRNEAE